MSPSPAAPTHCPYCALQCGMMVGRDDNGAWAVSPRDFPTNKGGLCRKGFTAASLLDSPERLKRPLLRREKRGALEPASWEEALDFVADKLIAIRAASGPDAIGVFGGGGLTNEKAYLLGKFARLSIGTANIDYNGRFCMASAAAAGLRAFGLDRGLPFPLEDIPEASVIIIFGSNPAETMPPIMQYFEEQRRRGGRCIVVDPRRTATAKAATDHLQVTPGTDSALANGLLHVAIQRGFADKAFIAERTSGFEAVRRVVARYWPDRVERITGIPAKKIEEIAELCGRAPSLMALSGRGPEQQSHGVDNVLSFINLVLALGQSGKRNAGYGCMTGQGNGQGGREHGQKADQLPGYRRLDNVRHRAEVAAVWGIDPARLPKPGLSACELLDEAGRAIRALLVFASNIVVSAPDALALAKRLGALDLLVVSDFFLSETAEIADVVLPVAQWAEEEGTMTNLEGRVIHRRSVKPPPEGVRSDIDVMVGIAARLGDDTLGKSADNVDDEFRRATAGGAADYAGITRERIDAEDGVFWPCPDAGHPGTPRLFLDRFATPDGRARFHAVEHMEPAERPDAEYPYFLTTGRILTQYQSGAQTRRVPSLVAAEPAPFLEIHPDTAALLSIRQGDWVHAHTRRGAVTLAARLTPDIRRDTVFAPFHWSGAGAANALTNAALDPISKIPEFKVCAVALERASAPTAPASAREILHS